MKGIGFSIDVLLAFIALSEKAYLHMPI